MDLTASLAETASQKAGRTHLAIFLEQLAGDDLDQVLAALRNPSIEQTHLARALTVEARKANLLPRPEAAISASNVKDWRIAAGVRS